MTFRKLLDAGLGGERYRVVEKFQDVVVLAR